MGNAGGFSSVGPTSDADGSTQKQTHGDGDHHGAFEMNNGQLEEMARFLDVSKTEIQLLWQRFLALGPGDDGALDRAVFQKSPYDEDIFCRQIWKRFSGSKGAPNKISFESFAKSMIWWQKAPVNYKLELLFSWMSGVDGITPHVLSRILKHVLPSYQEMELKIIADKMIKAISPLADPPLVKQEEFQQWMSQLPEEALRDALNFRIYTTYQSLQLIVTLSVRRPPILRILRNFSLSRWYSPVCSNTCHTFFSTLLTRILRIFPVNCVQIPWK